MEPNNLDSVMDSPPHNHVEATDYDLHFATWSLEYLRNAALKLQLVRPRSLAWAILLNALPPPSSDIITNIKAHRNFYNDLRDKLSMDPRAVIGDDPLSQNDESAWKQHFCDNELKALILQDVVRTYPEEVYFRDKDVQDLMVRVLFFWARSHSVGYRQGMHEILAPLLFELYEDRKYAPDDISDTLKCYLDKDYLEHDSHMLFNAVMKGVERFYSTGDVVPSSCGRLPTSTSVHSQNEVVRYLEHVKDEYLVSLDNELATHLAKCNISMELFGIRWLRLLFGREFPRRDTPRLWGFVFAEGPALRHLHYLVLALLLSMKKSLMVSESGAALSALMRPARAPAAHVCALALHLRSPHAPRPPSPPPSPPSPTTPPTTHTSYTYGSSWERTRTAEWSGSGSGSSGSEGALEGVAEGGDVARSLAALALVRARLPPAAAALAAALPRAPPAAQLPLRQILQLAALLQCRNHDLIDVETALEAAENQSPDAVGQHQIVPVRVQRRHQLHQHHQPRGLKEVPLKVFHQVECQQPSNLPSLDPLRLRTE